MTNTAEVQTINLLDAYKQVADRFSPTEQEQAYIKAMQNRGETPPTLNLCNEDGAQGIGYGI